MAANDLAASTAARDALRVTERPVRHASFEIIGRLFRVRLVPLAVVILGAFVLMAICAPLIQRYDPITDQSYSEANQGPSAAHWFGTDYLGRDMWSRLIHGSRISLTVGFISVGVGMFFGVTIGTTAGFLGGKVDAVLMRCTDAIWTFPALMLALAITSALGRGLFNSMLAIGIVGIPFFARLSRASTLSARELDYVLAARALGSTTPRIL
jgi:peptide/nickel transport system permease protein